MGYIEEICRLKYRYIRFLDTKQWDDSTDCYSDTARADAAGLTFANRDELVDYMRQNLGDGVITMHHVHHPEIDVATDGQSATGRWYLHDKVIVEGFRFVLEGAAFYEDRYVRTGDGWRIDYTGYERTYEMNWNLDDVPSLKVKVPRT